MATSSINHDFVVKDKKNIKLLADALSTPKTELPKPAKSISGTAAVTLFMTKWRSKPQKPKSTPNKYEEGKKLLTQYYSH